MVVVGGSELRQTKTLVLASYLPMAYPLASRAVGKMSYFVSFYFRNILVFRSQYDLIYASKHVDEMLLKSNVKTTNVTTTLIPVTKNEPLYPGTPPP